MNIRETIEQLESLRAHCKSMVHDEDSDTDFWRRDCEALDVALAMLQGKRIFPAVDWMPVETALPDNDTDVQVTVQELEPGGDTYRDVDCIIDDGDGPVWAANHGALERVLAWAPMLPVYQPEEGRAGNAKEKCDIHL